MKITELQERLTELQVQHGDVEVYTETGCGCCLGSRDLDPVFYEFDIFDGAYYANAVAL